MEKQNECNFESYAKSINAEYLRKIARLLGIENSGRLKKTDLIPILQDKLKSGDVKLKMFLRYNGKSFRPFEYLMRVLKHFEDFLNITHEASEELERRWNIYIEDNA